MGQYGNQPDFGTGIDLVTALPATAPNPSILYIGTVTSPATITVVCIDDTVATFTNITSGFFPIVVKTINAAVGILPADIIFVR